VNKKLGSEDRTKLDEYLTAVRQIEVRTERADAWLDVPKPKIDGGVANRFKQKMDKTQVQDYHRLFYDLMVLALRTDMTRVITCMSGSESNGLAIPEIGVPQTRHELSHHNGDPEQLRRLTMCDTFLAEQFAYVHDQLQSYKEDNQPLLESTMVLFGSGMAYGHSHGNANLPLVLAGGTQLGFKHGQHVDFNKTGGLTDYTLDVPRDHYKICFQPVNERAHLSNLLLTMAQAMGVETDQFADSNGTLSEVLA